MGDMDLLLNNHKEALIHYDQALRLAQQLNDKKNQINMLMKQGDVKLRMKRINAARSQLQ